MDTLKTREKNGMVFTHGAILPKQAFEDKNERFLFLFSSEYTKTKKKFLAARNAGAAFRAVEIK